MPSRNTYRIDRPDSYYHIYARGASKQSIYLDEYDYRYFEKLFARYLSKDQKFNKEGVSYPNFYNKAELLSFCLMENHFHLLVFQKQKGSITQLMRSLMTSYSRYFNLKHKRTGSLFESRYKSSIITTDSYLEHISRYIHLNPRYWKRYKHSSLRFYGTESRPEWIMPNKIINLFQPKESYYKFLLDYEDHKRMLDEIKGELADQ